MDDVIENCQVTFEEDGVNQQTLDELRKVGLFPLFFISLVAFSRRAFRKFGIAVTNDEAFYSCDFKAIKILTVLSFDIVGAKFDVVGAKCILLPLKTGWWTSLILQFKAGEVRPFDSLFISRNFPLFLPSAKSSPDPAIAERPPQFLHFALPFIMRTITKPAVVCLQSK